MKLTERAYRLRRAELKNTLKAAEQAFAAAALAAATGAGSSAEQREARDVVQETQEQMQALEAAWNAQADQRLRDEQAEERAAWAKTESVLEGMNAECVALGVEAADAFEQFLDAWGSIRTLRDGMRAALVPWSRHCNRNSGFPLMGLTRPPEAVSIPLLARMAEAGLPVLAISKFDPRAKNDLRKVLSGACSAHLDARLAFEPQSVREMEKN